MMDRPIIFSGPMIRALLDGRKTMTRRVLKRPTDHFHASYTHAEEFNGKVLWWDRSNNRLDGRLSSLPYAPGDRLWCREAFSYSWAVKDDPECRHMMPCWYWADGDHPTYGDWSKPKPSIHMPRWASRLTLTVTAVKVERLQDMEGQHPSESDAIKEGVRAIHHGDGEYYYSAFNDAPHPENWVDPTDAFRELWASIYGPDAWEANPWVAAITFTVERRNIDAPHTPASEG